MKSTTTVSTPVPEALDLPTLESNLDPEHPWPGLEGYDEGDEDYFKGRSEEIDDLYRLVRRERLTLLVGKAGTGKSSLIRAGLFPKQRREEALPIYVRLDYSEGAPALGAQVKTAVYEAARASNLEAPAPIEDQSLWEYLHLHDGEFWSRHHRIIMPFIVFDQFEELFTLGLASRDAKRAADVRVFISELSDLAEDRVPLHVLEDEGRANRHNLKRHHYKLVVCLREEYLAELDRMRDDLPPALFHNRMRLPEMTAEKAKQVVLETGAQVGADALADEIVQRASEDTREHRRDTEEGQAKSCVSPALLSVLCTTLNEKRIADGAAKISRSYLEALGPSLLTAFYERQLESLPEIPGERPWDSPQTRARKVNDRIAEEFVDGDVRVSIPESRARTVFGDAALAKLVHDKVLGYNQHGRVELIHDVLSPEVKKTQGRFLEKLVRFFRQAIRVAVVVGLLLMAASAVLGFDRGKRQASPPAPPPTPDVAPSVTPPFNPQNPAQAIALARGLVRDLNEGTRRIEETVAGLRQADWPGATRSLAYLDAYLSPARSFFCEFDAAPGSFWEADVNGVLDQACSAVEIQAEQGETLRGLVVRGEPVLFSSEVRDSVVGAWTGYEAGFNASKDFINRVVLRWVAESAPER
ncbi:MAG: ATP-binding protein [Gemmatimonadota bacterium]